MAQLGHSWGTKLKFLGHTWDKKLLGTFVAHLWHSRGKYSWGTAGAHLGHSRDSGAGYIHAFSILSIRNHRTRVQNFSKAPVYQAIKPNG